MPTGRDFTKGEMGGVRLWRGGPGPEEESYHFAGNRAISHSGFG